MPPDRKHNFTTLNKPLKTERTHEENQERAYIAASRRSDRSLEARIESARRASDIHKKRTGRGLRVTEQDVINEEMYEEEDDDLPTQYQRLNAHLQTSSWLFNRRLHDYIATQHGVRNYFMHQQFPGQVLPPPQYPTPPQFQPNSQIPSGQIPSGQIPLMNQQPMFPLQTISPTTPAFTTPPTFAPQGQPQPQPQPQQQPQLLQQQQQQQQHGFRQSPYSIPRRSNNMHQRAASVSTPLAMPSSGAPLQPTTPTVTTPGDDRRLSLPPHVLEQQLGQAQSRPVMSRSSSNAGVQQPSSSPNDTQQAASAPKSGQVTPHVKSENGSPAQYPFPSFAFDYSSQVITMNPLSLSLPPETQQFVGSALDPRDPRTAIFMAGSEQLPQPFAGTYTYNPNVSPKSARIPKGTDQAPTTMHSSGMSQTLAPENNVQLNAPVNESDSNPLPSAEMDNFFGLSDAFPQQEQLGFEFSELDGLPNDGSELNVGSELYEDNAFINWPQ